jgi:ABC-2 type transport system permease protein
MDELSNMIWIEMRKAIRSRMPLWTVLGSMFMPLSIAFLIFVARNPTISQKLGLISAKADLFKYSATDWSSYLGLSGQMIAMGGFFLFLIAIAWTFGREFTDGVIKDMLAVPVSRAHILLAKFFVATIWSIMLAVVLLVAGLIMGAVLKLPGGSYHAISQGAANVAVATLLTIVSMTPFALFASVGRGYLLPIGLAVLTLLMTNVVAVIGWGEYFPWAVAGLYMQGVSPLPPISYWIVVFTGLAGMIATYFWWKYADQNR